MCTSILTALGSSERFRGHKVQKKRQTSANVLRAGKTMLGRDRNSILSAEAVIRAAKIKKIFDGFLFLELIVYIGRVTLHKNGVFQVLRKCGGSHVGQASVCERWPLLRSRHNKLWKLRGKPKRGPCRIQNLL